MFPTCDQVERAAYERWLRRGQSHGRDREDWLAAEKELTFLLNYRTIVEYALDLNDRLILGDGRVRQCRFCERTSGQAAFTAPRPVVPAPIGNGSLVTAEICDECQIDCRDPLEADLRRFWSALRAEFAGSGPSPVPCEHGLFSTRAFKALIAAALLIMPERELRFFPDTMEWVNNPDHECDLSLFGGFSCRVYAGGVLGGRSSVSLARRIDDEAALPYLLCFLGCDGLVVQVHVPLSLRDEDLDGRRFFMPERAPAAGEGSDFRESHSTVLRLGLERGRTSPLSSLDSFR
jgi:hypothetical protein